MIQRPRPLLRALARLALRLVVLLVAMGALAASVWWDNAANRGITGEGHKEPIAWADVQRGGVNTVGLHLEVVTPAQRASGDNKVARTFKMIRDAGFHFVRVQFPWEDIEVCGKGDFRDHCRSASRNESTWTKYDYIVREARAQGLELIVRLDRPPAWARQEVLQSPEVRAAEAEGKPVTGPPDRLEDYAGFAREVARRYHKELRFYQIWNEPNLPGEWNYQRQQPAEFLRLLRVARSAIKAEDPDAVILFPSLSPTDGLDRTAVNDLDYLQGIYDAGGRDAFDIMSAQLYGLGQPPDEHRYIKPGKHPLRPIEMRTDVGRVVLLREIMVRNGDAGKAVWISELGWNSAPPSLPHPWGFSVSEEEKARYLVGAMERAEREWPWMGVMCVWMFRFGGEPPDQADPTPYFQLVDFDFRPLPAYQAVASYLRGNYQAPAARGSLVAPTTTGLAAVGVVAATAWLWPALATVAAGALGSSSAAVRVASRRMRAGLGGVRHHLARVRSADRLLAPIMVLGLMIFYWASPQLPLTLLGALIFLTVALLRPDLALLAVLATVPLYLAPKGVWDRRWGLSRPEGYLIPVHEVALLAAVGGALLHSWRIWLRPRGLVHLLRAHAFELLFLLAGTIGVAIAQERGRALREWRWMVVEPLIFYALVHLYGRKTLFRSRLLWTWLLAGTVVAVIGLVQLAGLNLALAISRQCFSDAVVAAEGVRRATSVYCHPNNLGLALGRVWPVLAALALATGPGDKDGGRARAGSSRGIRQLPALLAAVVLAGLAASFSRGALLGALAALVTLGVVLRRRVLLGAAAAALVLIAAGGLIAGVERLNPLGGSTSTRFELWGSAVAMLRDHPLLGIGLDQFLLLRTQQVPGPYITPEAAATNERYASHPHNLLLDLLLRVGPIGVIAMAMLLLRFFQHSRTLLRNVADGERAVAAGLLAAMVAALVHGLGDNFYFVQDLAIVFWLQVGLIELLWNDQRPTTNDQRPMTNDQRLMMDEQPEAMINA